MFLLRDSGSTPRLCHPQVGWLFWDCWRRLLCGSLSPCNLNHIEDVGRTLPPGLSALLWSACRPQRGSPDVTNGAATLPPCPHTHVSLWMASSSFCPGAQGRPLVPPWFWPRSRVSPAHPGWRSLTMKAGDRMLPLDPQAWVLHPVLSRTPLAPPHGSCRAASSSS